MTAPSARLGIDASKWNRGLDYAALSEAGVTFIIVRLTNGVAFDHAAAEHIRHARREAWSVGGYHFFRAHQSVADQFDAFAAADDAVGYEPGDIIPSCDIEHDPGAPEGQRDPTPLWSPLAQEFSALLTEYYGAAQTYCTRYDWVRLGRPQWVLDTHLWTPHWGVKEPATPGDNDALIWQNKVGPLPGTHGAPIDQDLADSLVLVPEPGPLGLTRGEVERIEDITALTIDTSVRNPQQ